MFFSCISRSILSFMLSENKALEKIDSVLLLLLPPVSLNCIFLMNVFVFPPFIITVVTFRVDAFF